MSDVQGVYCDVPNGCAYSHVAHAVITRKDAELAAAQQRIASLEETVMRDAVRMSQLVDERDEARATAERLTAALQRFGEHSGSCNSVQAWGAHTHPCDCGLSAALSSTASAATPPPGRAAEQREALMWVMRYANTHVHPIYPAEHPCSVCYWLTRIKKLGIPDAAEQEAMDAAQAAPGEPS